MGMKRSLNGVKCRINHLNLILPLTYIMTFTLKEIIEMITLLRLIIMALMVTITVG